MRICPQCGGPFTDDDTVIASKDVRCERCGWSGKSDGTVFVDNNITGMENFQAQLEQLYVGMAQHVAPLIGKLLIDTKMMLSPEGLDSKVDRQRIELLAKVLQGATRGSIEGIAGVIKEEMNHGRN